MLRALGALAGPATLSITDRGRRIAALGLHPRLARALLDGSELVGRRTAAEVVALMDDDTSTDSDDVETALKRLRSAGGRWRQEVRRLEDRLQGAAPAPRRAGTATRSSALVVGLAQPERLARQRAGGGNVYLLAGGTAVELSPGSPLAGHYLTRRRRLRELFAELGRKRKAVKVFEKFLLLHDYVRSLRGWT